MKGDEDKVIASFRSALEAEGWRTQLGPRHGYDVLAHGPDGGRLFVEAKGTSDDIGIDADTMFGQLLRRMLDEHDDKVRYAAVIRDDPRSVRAVERVPKRVRDLLRIDVYAVAASGAIRRLT